MKYLALLFSVFLILSCDSSIEEPTKKIIFLHHSTGRIVWVGNTNRLTYKLTNKGDVEAYFEEYNKENGVNFVIEEQAFPSTAEYGWKNYPFDYYNIWVKNAGDEAYMGEPTLEMLTEEYDIIILKHCFPVSQILEDTGAPDIDSEDKKLENYLLQYNALKEKMHEFPDNQFVVWTPAVHAEGNLAPEKAERTNEFYQWMMNEWDEEGDNIVLWDFYNYETEGGLYLLEKYSVGEGNSHPNKQLGAKLAPLFAQFIINLAEESK